MNRWLNPTLNTHFSVIRGDQRSDAESELFLDGGPVIYTCCTHGGPRPAQNQSNDYSGPDDASTISGSKWTC